MQIETDIDFIKPIFGTTSGVGTDSKAAAGNHWHGLTVGKGIKWEGLSPNEHIEAYFLEPNGGLEWFGDYFQVKSGVGIFLDNAGVNVYHGSSLYESSPLMLDVQRADASLDVAVGGIYVKPDGLKGLATGAGGVYVKVDGASVAFNGSGQLVSSGVPLSSTTPVVVKSTGAAGAGTSASKDSHYHALNLDTSYVDLYFDVSNVLHTKRLYTAATDKAIISAPDVNGMYVPIDDKKGLIGASGGIAIKLHTTNPGLEFDSTNGMRMLAATTAARGGVTLDSGGDTSKYLNGNGAWTVPAGGGGGSQGPQGLQGFQGFQGFQGRQGTGVQGFQGWQGTGVQGFQGPQGPVATWEANP
jgi:hypothetical protein